MTRPTWTPETRPLHRVFTAVASPQVTGALVLVCAIVIAVLIVVLRPHEAVISEAPALTGEAADQPSELLGTAGEESRDALVVVHVTGGVRSPGVVELSQGARVGDAVEAAGGAVEDAVLDAINLARTVIDGEHIHVPDDADHSGQVQEPGPAGASSDGKVRLNHADAADLEQLPGIGPALAQRVMEWRQTHGGFTQVEDLLQVSGIGPKVFEGLRDLVVAP